LNPLLTSERKERRRILGEIEKNPKSKMDAVREIFWKKGFRQEDLEKVTKKITSDKDVWLDTLLVEDGIQVEEKSPVQ
jgi:hypothetical protein